MYLDITTAQALTYWKAKADHIMLEGSDGTCHTLKPSRLSDKTDIENITLSPYTVVRIFATSIELEVWREKL